MSVQTIPVVTILQDIELVVEGVFVAELFHLCHLPLIHGGKDEWGNTRVEKGKEAGY